VKVKGKLEDTMKKVMITILMLGLVVLSACGPRQSLRAAYAGGSQTWIDAPLPGSSLPLAEVEIVAHASSPDGIASFEIDLNGQPLTSIDPAPGSLDPNFKTMRYSWQPAAAGKYLIEVGAVDSKHQNIPPAQALVQVDGVATSTPTLVATETSTPTFTPTQVPTNTNGPLTFTPGINAYCREGPDEIFAPLRDPAMNGIAYLMDGRNFDGSWYRIMLTSVEGCWVPAGVGTSSGDPMRLRVLAEVPTPTMTPEEVINCPSFTDQFSCQSQSSCEWKFSSFGPGRCVNK
jgi:hypothetical protein